MPFTFPLSSAEATIWLGIIAFMLLVVMELMSPYYRHIRLTIEKERFKQVTLVIILLFFGRILVEIYARLATTYA